jgi:hypothetical protein
MRWTHIHILWHIVSLQCPLSVSFHFFSVSSIFGSTCRLYDMTKGYSLWGILPCTRNIDCFHTCSLFLVKNRAQFSTITYVRLSGSQIKWRMCHVTDNVCAQQMWRNCGKKKYSRAGRKRVINHSINQSINQSINLCFIYMLSFVSSAHIRINVLYIYKMAMTRTPNTIPTWFFYTQSLTMCKK